MQRKLKNRWPVIAVTSALAACAGSSLPSPPVLEGEHSLIIQISSLSCCDGTLRVAVYHHKDYWLKPGGMIRGRIGFVAAERQTVEVHGLPAGTYAVAVHQDVDGDGVFDKRFGFLPKEPYGFSNNVGRYGPASFDAAAIVLEKDITIDIALHTPAGSGA